MACARPVRPLRRGPRAIRGHMLRVAGVLGLVLSAPAQPASAASDASASGGPAPAVAFLDMARAALNEWGVAWEYGGAALSDEANISIGSLKLAFPLLPWRLDAPAGAGIWNASIAGDGVAAETFYVGGFLTGLPSLGFGPLQVDNLRLSDRGDGAVPRHVFAFDNFSSEFQFWDDRAGRALVEGLVTIGTEIGEEPATYAVFGQVLKAGVDAALLPVLSDVASGPLRGRANFEVVYSPEEARLSLAGLAVSVTGVGQAVLSLDLLGVDAASYAAWWALRAMRDPQAPEMQATMVSLLERLKIESARIELHDDGFLQRYADHRASAHGTTAEQLDEEMRSVAYAPFLTWSGRHQEAVDALADTFVDFTRRRTRFTLAMSPPQPVSLLEVFSAYADTRSADIFALLGVSSEAAPPAAARTTDAPARSGPGPRPPGPGLARAAAGKP